MQFENKSEEKLWVKLLVEGVKLRDGVTEYPKPYLKKVDNLVKEFRERRKDRKNNHNYNERVQYL